MSSTRGTRSGRRVRGALFLVVLALLSMLVGAEGMRVGGDAEGADGRAAFYAQPSPVQAGAPGALVKTEELVGVLRRRGHGGSCTTPPTSTART